jgi:peptidoglycan/LPS O-acetylase OafA/YrhL
MTICAHCGVELDDGMKICPLCGMDMEKNEDQEYVSNNYPSDIIKLQKKEKKRFLWELSAVIAFSAVAVCTLVDLLVSKGLKWSLYTDIPVSAIWVILTLFRFAHKRIILLVISILITILAALFLINLISPDKQWFFPLGLPVMLAAFLAFGIVLALYRAARLKGLNIIAVALVVLSGFCILLEITLDAYLNGAVHLRWSLIAAVSVIPVALIFLFYHYRLQQGKRLDSLFHI